MSNTAISYFFVVLMFTGVGLIKVSSSTSGWMLILICIGFGVSAWFFMGGLLSALRPAPPQPKAATDTESNEAKG
ncbi:hypothetical protein [Pseudomonas alliivorans]|uniref:hypothetical protein n=1 Tax=Pseudomonas alliivorans TaxID=2810613 RepID=UPI00403A8028